MRTGADQRGGPAESSPPTAFPPLKAERPEAEPPKTTPPAQGVRLPWSKVPGQLRHEVERLLDSQVVRATTQPGGFSPGAAARLELANGQRAFVKAVGPAQNPDSPGIYRQEAAITACLPANALAPRLLASFEDNGWVALLFEDIEGWTPAQPWIPAELDRVLAELTQLADALTPAPAGVDVPPVARRFGRAFRGWRLLADAASRQVEIDGLDPWARSNLDRLADLEAGWEAATVGDSLVHMDLRADNLLLTSERVYVVDWPWACTAQPWIDLILMLPSIHLQQGPPPESIWAAFPLASRADPKAVTAVVAALAGYLVDRSRQPAPKGIPTVREFQRALAEIALAWLRERVDPAD